MSSRSQACISRNVRGYAVRIEGRGTLRESAAVHAFARYVLDVEPGTLVLDLSSCDYLDSTFLGALVALQKRYGQAEPYRFLIVAGPDVRKRLFGPNCLDAFFQYTDELPPALGAERELPAPRPARDALGRHILDCHQRLLELGGPSQQAIEEVVEQLSLEMFTH